MDPRSIIATKRDGGCLSPEEITSFLSRYVKGEIADYHAAALLTAIYIHGMQPEELVEWTRAMLHSGTTLSFEDVGRPVVDKHSTGGVGDKVSIPLAPAVAACGVCVPMVSGRGLGHTGGTLDKLESIPGLTTELGEERFGAIVREHGFAFASQTANLVPADRKLYALRDATGLVASVPLIASSIMSKKLAEGLDALVLDVKFGSGAFLPELEDGRVLAEQMLSIAKGMGVKASAFQTNMHRPLGASAGHALEIRESLECLRGDGPEDLRELVCTLGGEMLVLGGLEPELERGKARVARALDDGSAHAAFVATVEAQGGDLRRELERAPDVEVVESAESGTFRWTSAREIGLAVCALGGGRVRLEDEIDVAVGVRFLRRGGERVERGDALFEIHHRAGRGLEAARRHLQNACRIGEHFEPGPLIHARLEA